MLRGGVGKVLRVCHVFLELFLQIALYKEDMSENVYWVIELAVTPGRFEDLKTLVAELEEANRNKVGFLTWAMAISDDRQVFHIYERFEDSAAIMNHMQSFGPKFSERFFEILKPTRFVIYGTPSAEVKDAVAPFNPVYMTPLASFRKHSANDI